jgi:hypothetical protein
MFGVQPFNDGKDSADRTASEKLFQKSRSSARESSGSEADAVLWRGELTGDLGYNLAMGAHAGSR